MKEVSTVIMGGGQGARLFPLTRDRAKPAVPVGGRSRLIDIALSNCINSGLTQIYVLTQFNSASLNRHISQTYNFGSLLPAGVQVLAAALTAHNRSWFQGTADAVRRSLRHAIGRRTRLVLILAGDHLYRMNYLDFLRRHDDSGADITISVCPVSEEHAPGFGLVHCDEKGMVTRFAEKPTGEELEKMRVDPATPLESGNPIGAPFLASMGIYVFSPDVLTDLLTRFPEQHDFGRELIPQALSEYSVAVHAFRGYWEDIGTIRAFYRANLALAVDGEYSLYDPDFPLYTHPRYLSPTCIEGATVEQSLIAEGSIIGTAKIRRSVVGIRSRLWDGVELDGALVMGNDHYETAKERAAARERGVPPLGIGAGSVVRRAIVDKQVRIGEKVEIVNATGADTFDGPNYYVRDGIVIVPREAIIPDGTVI